MDNFRVKGHFLKCLDRIVDMLDLNKEDEVSVNINKSVGVIKIWILYRD
jgi:hypothetical protein